MGIKRNNTSKFQAHEVTLMIQKDMTTHLPLTCPLFEYAILEVLHPEATLEVRAVGAVKTYDRAEEFDRMDQKYGANPDTKRSYVEEVYGRNGSNFEEMEAQLEEQLNIDALGVDNTKLDTDEMTVADLRKELEKRDIEFPKTASKARLLSILKSAMDDEEESASGPGDEEDGEENEEEGEEAAA